MTVNSAEINKPRLLYYLNLGWQTMAPLLVLYKVLLENGHGHSFAYHYFPAMTVATVWPTN